MSANKNVVITLAARKKLLRARAGDATLPKVSSMVFGDGGVTSDGTVIAPAAGKEISEIGLVDTDGDVLCIKTFTRKGKDDDVRQTYTIDDVF